MKKVGEILAPGDPIAGNCTSLILVDHRFYDERQFHPLFDEVRLGPGITRCSEGGAAGFRLADPVSREVEAITRVRSCVLFYASSDTHVETFAPVARHCDQPVFVVSRYNDQGARNALRNLGMSCVENRLGSLAPKNAEIAVMANDWGWEEREFIARCRSRGIPTVCLQESPNVDFDGPPFRMRRADVVCVQGPSAMRDLNRRAAFCTGNPRFDSYAPVKKPDEPLVAVNCNFTYGLGIDWSRAWVDSVLSVLREIGVPYRIVRHPRDETDLSGISNAVLSTPAIVGRILQECSLLISRDSSLPYEALLLGRSVIYYDPFREKERRLREEEGGLFTKCISETELRSCIPTALASTIPIPRSPDHDLALARIFTAIDGKNSLRVARAISLVAQRPAGYIAGDAIRESRLTTTFGARIQCGLRPKLKRIPWLRRLWRGLRKSVGL